MQRISHAISQQGRALGKVLRDVKRNIRPCPQHTFLQSGRPPVLVSRGHSGGIGGKRNRLRGLEVFRDWISFLRTGVSGEAWAEAEPTLRLAGWLGEVEGGAAGRRGGACTVMARELPGFCPSSPPKCLRQSLVPIWELGRATVECVGISPSTPWHCAPKAATQVLLRLLRQLYTCTVS